MCDFINAPRPTIPTTEKIASVFANDEDVTGCGLLVGNVVTSKEIKWTIITCYMATRF